MHHDVFAHTGDPIFRGMAHGLNIVQAFGVVIQEPGFDDDLVVDV